jgi:hypothetical protein
MVPVDVERAAVVGAYFGALGVFAHAARRNSEMVAVVLVAMLVHRVACPLAHFQR